MNEYCLNTSEIDRLIDYVKTGIEPDDMEFCLRLGYAETWQVKLVCVTLLFARVLERRNPNVGEPERMLNALFTLDEKMYLEIQECGLDLVDYMLRNARDAGSSFEQSVIDLQNGYGAHKYDQTLCG